VEKRVCHVGRRLSIKNSARSGDPAGIYQHTDALPRTQEEEEGTSCRTDPSHPLPILIFLGFQRCDGERPICQACICLKKEHLCFYEVVSSVTKLQEENQAYKDKIRYLEQALTLNQPLPNLNVSYGPSFASSSNSDASSSTTDGVRLSQSLPPLPCMTGTSLFSWKGRCADELNSVSSCERPF
jgi:hypothetical protein